MNISEFDYDLPKELIAQFPTKNRDDSRLLVIERESGQIIHSRFKDLGQFINSGDAMVLNDTKVNPVRLIGTIEDREIDILLVERLEKNKYMVKANPGKKLKPGREIVFKLGVCTAICRESEEAFKQGMKLIEFMGEHDVELLLEDIGMMPLPPYIKRKPEQEDKQRYQTIYAKNSGAIAAPTAGLHFTEQTMVELKAKGINFVSLTLHVGLGTFIPVKVENITQHIMHEESYVVSPEAANSLEKIKKMGGRICAVGTTVARVLESCAYIIEEDKLKLRAGRGKTGIFIYPPYNFKATDMLLTDFHLPRTTLIMLVCALAGRDLTLKAYNEAVEKKYRFFSFGDCMLIK